MAENSNLWIYEQRIYRVQDYVCSNLEKCLTLDHLAEISGFSPFHFHRLFKSVAKETLYDFIQRMRMERSCSMLRSKSDVKITHIALSCGFATSSSFSKAFKNYFNVSPTDYRNRHRNWQSKPGTVDSKNGTLESKRGKDSCAPGVYISDSDLESLYRRRKHMNVKIENMPIYRLAYMRQIGPYGPGNLQLMQRLKKWAITRDLLSDSSIILGIAHDDPEVSPPEKCRYDCCIVISEAYELESDMSETCLPGGKYAVFAVEHSAEAVAKAWNNIFASWLPESGYLLDNKPVFERYLGGSGGIDADLCEICVPIKGL